MLDFSHSSQELPQVWPTAGKAAANHYDRDRCHQGCESAAAAEAPEPLQAPSNVMVVNVRRPVVSVARILHMQKRSIAPARKDHEGAVGQPHHPQSLGNRNRSMWGSAAGCCSATVVCSRPGSTQ